MRSIPLIPAALAAATCLASTGAAAGTLFEFHWDGGSGNELSATGVLELDDAIGVGQSFDTEDVTSIEVELFDGATPVGTATHPPFDIGFDAIVGTRTAAGLNLDDFLVSPEGIFFGCTAGNCLSAEVRFKTAMTGEFEIEYPSIQAARDSFVVVELPEPTAPAAGAIALLALLGMRAAHA